ncbi:MAG: hypothetical protein QXD62_01705 [Candidatus Woesearchaeota archaeon]
MKKPLFIQIKDYEEIKDLVRVLETKFLEAENLLKEIDDLHLEEKKEIDAWHDTLKEVEDKLRIIKSVLE